MTVATLNMPRLGETMDEGKIVGWLVEVGQEFNRGDAILEVETDKTVVEYPALGDGVLAEILVDDGDMVDVGDPIARIDLGEGADWTQEGGDGAEVPSPVGVPAKTVVPEPMPQTFSRTGGERLRATPLARYLARGRGIILTSVSGTGRRGRIEASDVQDIIDGNVQDYAGVAHGIAYVETGARTGAAYLLIHGFAGDHTTFAILGRGLQKSGARVIACDLPGHGKTATGATSSADLSAGMAKFARAVMGSKPFHLVAHSLGAVPALALAEVFDLASLTLIAPVGLAEVGNADFLTGMAKPGSVQEMKTLLSLLTVAPTGLSDTAIDGIFVEQSRGRLAELAADLGKRQRSIYPALNGLATRIPTRLLLGDSDSIVGDADLAGLPPEIGVHRFANVGHMPHWENPRAVLNIVLAAKTS